MGGLTETPIIMCLTGITPETEINTRLDFSNFRLSFCLASRQHYGKTYKHHSSWFLLWFT